MLEILSAIGSIALVITLVYVIKYTRATVSLAMQTHASVDLQREEIGLQKRPVVLFLCADERQFHFRTMVRNFGMVHAKACVKATITIDGKVLRIPPRTHYTGERIWQLQAGGPNGFPKLHRCDSQNERSRKPVRIDKEID